MKKNQAKLPSQPVVLLACEALYGGGTKQTWALAKALQAQGERVVVIANQPDTWLGQQLASEANQPLPNPVEGRFCSAMQRDIQLKQELRVLWELFHHFRELKPKVVLSSGAKLIGQGGLAAWLAGVPRRFSIIRGEGAAPGSKRLQAIYAMERILGYLGTRTICVSNYILQQRLQRGLYAKELLTALPDGIDTERFANLTCQPQHYPGLLKQQFNWPSDSVVVGMVGRLVPGKRYSEFIEVLRLLHPHYPKLRGALVGEGEDRDALQAQINAAGLQRVVGITGYMQDMPAVYADLDISVLLTDYEGCPNSVLESMAAGLPTLASAVCGVAELMQHGETGYLLHNGLSQKTAELLARLLDNPEWAEAMGQAAQRHVQQHFNGHTQINRLADCLLGPATEPDKPLLALSSVSKSSTEVPATEDEEEPPSLTADSSIKVLHPHKEDPEHQAKPELTNKPVDEAALVIEVEVQPEGLLEEDSLTPRSSFPSSPPPCPPTC